MYDCVAPLVIYLQIIQATIFTTYAPCPGFVFHLSETKGDEGDPKGHNIDASLIEEGLEDLIRPGAPNWGLQSLNIEFKRGGKGLDPFNDKDGEDIEETSTVRQEVRGQIMSHADRVFSRHHRTALYQLFVDGPEFRVLRCMARCLR